MYTRRPAAFNERLSLLVDASLLNRCRIAHHADELSRSLDADQRAFVIETLGALLAYRKPVTKGNTLSVSQENSLKVLVTVVELPVLIRHFRRKPE